MEKNELIERYIYAVTKHMKPAMKKDVAEELQSIIQDMLDERCQDTVPTERDIRVVLAELGTPAELAQKYDADSQQCLIGAPYYGTYKYIMKIVLICVTCGMFLAQIMAAMANHSIWYKAVADTIAGIVGGWFSSFAFVTLLFAIFYRKGVKMDTLYDSIDNLPPVPKKSNKISKAEPIAGIIFCMVFTIIFLVCPQLIAVFIRKEDINITATLFNIDYIHQTWYFVVMFAILGVAGECVKLIEGAYTKRLMIVTIVTDTISIILTALWLTDGRIFNPEFGHVMMELFQKDGGFIATFFANFNLFFMGMIIFALAIDMIEAIVKTLVSKNE